MNEIFENSNSESIKKYNDDGRLIYSSDGKGFECWMEYDDRGLISHYKDSKGVERTWLNDTKGHRLKHTRTKYFEEFEKINENGMLYKIKKSLR